MPNEFIVKNGLVVGGNVVTSGTITINGALAATQSWVTSQAYLTSASLSGYATQSYVTSAISSLIDAAPAALDTLNELAAALGDDANFSTTITNSIASKLPLAGGTLTGALNGTSASFSSNVTLGNNADLVFQDLAGTFPTSGKGFDWTLNNDGARIYAIQPNSDSIDFVFQLRDNATTNDRFVFWVAEWQGPAYDKYPLIISGGTQFDLKDSALYTNTVLRLSNSGVLQNVTGNISMFTNNAGYLTSYTETDTLATVTGRGATTTSAITVGTSLSITGPNRTVTMFSTSNYFHVQAYSGSTNGGQLWLGNDNDPGFYVNASQHFFRGLDSSNKMYINGTSGNVGIGTTTPLYKLDVVGAIRSNASNVGTLNLGTDSYSSTYLTAQVIGQTSPSYTSTGKLSFKVLTWGAGSDYGPTEQMYIDVTGPDTKTATLVMLPWGGNVGIGTTSPTQKLEVGNFLDAVTNRITVASRYEYEPEFNFRLGQSGTNYDWVGAVISSGDDGNYNGKILFKTANAGRDTPTTKMAIKANGNVGIGTASPSYKLDVAGSIRTQDGYIIGANGNADITIDGNIGSQLRYGTQKFTLNSSNASISTNNTTRLFVSNAGDVGIGTTNPIYKLEVNGNLASLNSSAAGLFSVSGTRSIAIQSFAGDWNYIRSNNANLVFGTQDAANLYIRTNDTDRIFVNTAGKVAIGTTDTNSDKSDFTVYTGGTTTLSLAGDLLRVGDSDVNWGVALRSNGFLETYNQPLYIRTWAGSHPVVIGPNVTNTVEFHPDYTLFNGLNLSISRVNSTHATNYFRGDSSHLVIGTGGTLYLNYGGNTTNITGNVNITGGLTLTQGIGQNNLVGRPYAVWGVSGTTTGAVVIKFPGNTSNYGMVHAVIDIYEYGGNTVSTIIVGGHNWGSQWYNYGANLVGQTDKQVRVAVVDGSYAIVIGDNSSSWSYGQVVLRKIQNGSYYQNIMNVSEGYTVTQTASLTSSWISGDLRQLTVSGQINASGGNSSQWNSAYSWGNHATAGYLTSYSETDTLASVTGRGATTTTAITVRGITATKDTNQITINRVDGGGATWQFYSWPGGLNIFPNSQLPIFIGRDGSVTDFSLWNGKLLFENKNAIEGNYDSWLRLNNSSQYASGVYTPGVMRADGGFNVSGSTVWHAGNDGSGSGLDADTVDGVQADSIVYGNARGTNQSITNNNNDLDKTGYYTADGFTTKPSGVANWMYIEHIKLYNDNTAYQKQLGYDTYDDRMWVRTKSGGAWSSWKQIWTSDVFANNSSNWNTAYGWGNHATAGYLTSVSDVWVNTSGDSMTGTLSFAQPVGLAFANGQYIKDNSSGGLIISSGAAVNINGTSVTINGNTAWHAGNDGSGSGLDADTVDGIDSGSFLRSDVSDSFSGTLTMATQRAFVPSNYGHGVYGLYSAERYQHVWSMGAGYDLPADGVSNGNGGSLYGLAWSYNPDYSYVGSNAQSKPGLNHQLLLMMNGITYTALGNGIWTSGTITTTSHGNSSQWNTAYSWGNHASAGYQSASTAITTSNIGSQSVSYANSAGYAGYVNNQSGQLVTYDNRTISPSETNAGYLQFGFTSWDNNGGSPYADYLHMRSYTDGSGGNDNLVMFLKSGIGMRIYQQTFGSATAYSSYADVWTSANFTSTNVSNWNTAYSWGNHASQSYATTSYVTTQINNLIAGAPGALDTLDELAAALGDDSNFATTVTNSIAGKVSKAGDTMTGNLQVNAKVGTLDNQGIYLRGNGDATHKIYYRTSDGGNVWEYNSPIKFEYYNGGNPLTRLTLDIAGNLTIGGFLTESSSLKLKENIEISEGNLEKVVNLRPVTYNKIGSETKELGLIAEEVAEVYPEFVQYDENGEPIGVNYSRLTAALIGAVKELTNQVQELNKKING